MSVQLCLKSENDTDYWPDKANLLNKDILGLSDDLERQCECAVSSVLLRVSQGDMKLINDKYPLMGRKEFKCLPMYQVLNCPSKHYLFDFLNLFCRYENRGQEYLEGNMICPNARVHLWERMAWSGRGMPAGSSSSIAFRAMQTILSLVEELENLS